MKKRTVYNLKTLRLERGLTQAHVAEATGIKRPTLAAIEDGRGEGFDVAMKHALADFFGVPMFSLFSEELERVQKIMRGRREVENYLEATARGHAKKAATR